MMSPESHALGSQAEPTGANWLETAVPLTFGDIPQLRAGVRVKFIPDKLEML